jgi:hypothetical protein
MEIDMSNVNFRIKGKNVVLNTKGKIDGTPDELMNSGLFAEILMRCVNDLKQKDSYLLGIFGKDGVSDEAVEKLKEALFYLTKQPADQVPNLVSGTDIFFKDLPLLGLFVEYLYNYWRSYDRFVVCVSEGDGLDKRPYRTFNQTIETLTHLVRGVYRDVQENISGTHPRIYRQVHAGAEIGAIALPGKVKLSGDIYRKLDQIPVIRQVLLNPPLILNPPNNRRTGQFIKVETNPFSGLEFDAAEWLCYPAKVGSLLILIYFHEKFYELGFSLCNLFELADDEDLKNKPDAVYAYGAQGDYLDGLAKFPTVFHEDEENGILCAAVPGRDEFGYFGYLKKMVLTLHNIRMMKQGKFPYHGAFVKIMLHGGIEKNILLIGDTGAGKSETLEAFRNLGADQMRDMIIIADDMGSIDINDGGDIVGYGTEIGAFLRLDDLRPGYAFGQIDRSIIMSPAQVNARIVMPVTTFESVIAGHNIDMVLYANNYEEVDDDHPVIEQFNDVDRAFDIFREGTVMSKGTTTSTGIVHSYFANIFGPAQYKELHDKLGRVFFNAFFTKKVYVGQMRTRLGINGYETTGPEESARALLDVIKGG